MKRVVVRARDDTGQIAAFASDEMTEDAAHAERDRIEREHAEAGSENRWIRVAGHSIQSRQIQTISVEELPSVDFDFGDEEPFFRRDMQF